MVPTTAAAVSNTAPVLVSSRLARTVACSLAVAIALVTVLVFFPVLRADWVDWDDQTNFLDNPYYRGLQWSRLQWMLTTNLMGHWIPVTWLTLGMDYVVWGMNPFGYHLTNLLWHTASAVLFYLVARRLLGLAMPSASSVVRSLGAGAAALFFAIHPLRVESVAWITERRALTSGFFLLLAVLSYLKTHERPPEVRAGWRLVALGSTALALGSKAIVMGLPLVLVILDIYPLRRLGPGLRDWRSSRGRSVWLEKIPFALLAAAAAVIAFNVQRSTGYLTPATLETRLAITAYNVWFHAWKTFVPLNLSPVYELPLSVSPLEGPYLWSALAVLAITATVWIVRRHWPPGLATWAFYLAMLAPVSGIVHTGYHLGADRNTYIACAGFAVLVGALVALVGDAWQRGTLRRAIAAPALALCLAWIVGLGLSASIQTTVWQDSETLWRYAVEIDPACSVCQHHFAARPLRVPRQLRRRAHGDGASTRRPGRAALPHCGQSPRLRGAAQLRARAHPGWPSRRGDHGAGIRPADAARLGAGPRHPRSGLSNGRPRRVGQGRVPARHRREPEGPDRSPGPRARLSRRGRRSRRARADRHPRDDRSRTRRAGRPGVPVACTDFV
jgi:hypothetical protein